MNKMYPNNINPALIAFDGSDRVTMPVICPRCHRTVPNGQRIVQILEGDLIFDGCAYCLAALARRDASAAAIIRQLFRIATEHVSVAELDAVCAAAQRYLADA